MPCVGWEFQKEIAHLQGFHNPKLQKWMHFSAVTFISFLAQTEAFPADLFFYFECF